jgi:threonine dehydratase
VDRAQRFLAGHAPPTPLVHAPVLSRRFGVDVRLKLESFSPVGSFKWRGVLYRFARLPPRERANGVVTASTGNHGYAVAWAAKRLGIPATVVLPTGTPLFKRRRIADLGATTRVRGRDWNQSLIVARRIAAQEGAFAVDDGEDPILMAGTATIGREIAKQAPDADAIVAPIGGGNLAAAILLGVRPLAPRVKLFGVQASQARGAHDSWRTGRIVSRSVGTMAGGIATAAPARLAFQILHERLKDFVLVGERQMMRAVARLALDAGVVAEPSGAAPVAAMDRLAPRLKGKRVVLVVTGRTIDAAMLRECLALVRR